MYITFLWMALWGSGLIFLSPYNFIIMICMYGLLDRLLLIMNAGYQTFRRILKNYVIKTTFSDLDHTHMGPG